MKTLKIYLLLIVLLSFNACNLDEDPPILSKSAYNDLTVARSVLDGVYGSFTGYDFLVEYIFTTNLFSGHFITRRLNGGKLNKSDINTSIASLNPRAHESVNLTSTWRVLYNILARCNNIIEEIPERINPTTSNEYGFNNVLGQAYFVRAYVNFLLVRLYGQVPLRTELATPSTINISVSTENEIYTQILQDAQRAIALINDDNVREGYPKSLAVNMLMAKVYMTLATAPSSVRDASISTQQYWQLAYNEAIKLYGQYALHSDYAELFTPSGDNSSESIFELQSNEATSRFAQAFTPPNYIDHATWGFLFCNPLAYDSHAAAYGDEDPRLASTYISYYQWRGATWFMRYYPTLDNNDRAGNNFWNGFPAFFKFSEKVALASGTAGRNSQNYIVYRYADLLLMLAEISNELQNGEQLGYVTEVLDRVGLTPRSEYYTSQDSFRDAIMEEYRFELMGEGETGFTNRRRGFNYFLQHTILEQNNYQKFNDNVDLTFSTVETEVMTLPIPSSEKNTNEQIN